MAEGAPKDLFDHLKNVTRWKIPFNENSPRDTTNYTQYMINRYLSMSPQTINVAVILNRMKNIPDKVHHDYIMNVLPEGDKFFPYVKAKKEANAADLNLIMAYYKVGTTQAREYYQLLSSDQMKFIRSRFNTGVIKRGKSV